MSDMTACLNELSYIPLNNEQNEPTQGDIGETSNDPTQAKRNEFKELYASANEELYPGCDYVTRLDFMTKFTYFKAKDKLTDSIFNEMLEFFQNVFPTAKGYKLPPSYYAIKKTFKTIELGYESIHAYNAIRVNSMNPDQSDIASSLPFSQQSLLLAELEFRKMFLAYNYVGRERRKLEDVVSVQDAIDIITMKTGPMFDFEAKISAKYGRANCEPSDRHLDWDSGKTYLYHCYGPFVNTRTHLQRELGDDNVLIVQFTYHFDPDMPFDQQRWITARQTIFDRISIGVRHYSLFAFKDDLYGLLNAIL
nr:probable RNA-dependent RNA polymerase 5 [Tanacetum cinerariifolium]